MPQPRLIPYDDIMIPAPEVARIHGISPALLNKRLNKGEPVPHALRPAEEVERLITVDGETHCIRQWARIRGIPSTTIRMRLDRDNDWTERQALGFDPPPQPLPPILLWISSEMKRQKLSARRLEREASLSKGQIRLWSTGKVSPLLGNIIACAWVLGSDIQINRTPVKSAADLVRWLMEKASNRKANLPELARISGIPYTTLKCWRSGTCPRLDLFLKCLKALGLKFPKPVPRRSRG